MTLAAVLVATLALFPSGGALHPVLAESASPLDPLAEISTELWLVFHDDRSLPLAFFAPAEDLAWAFAWVEGVEASSLLPRLALPRLLLARRAFIDPQDGELRPFAELPLDTVDALTRSLFRAWLPRRAAAPAFRDRLAMRATERLEELPATERLPVYLGMLADYAAHIVALDHEVRRSVARRRAAGRAPPCGLLEPPVGIFALWQQAFDDVAFPGEGTDASGRYFITGAVLNAEDKRWVERFLLADRFAGEPRTDFAWLCADVYDPEP
ncbi:MAG: hypothetical protein AAGD38_24160 [Acidobacteriota bacterium]